MIPAPGVITYAPDGVSDKRHLGAAGHLSALNWGSTMPGGDAAFSATLQIPSLYRDPALGIGRVLQVVKAGAVVYEGRLDRPAPASGGAGWDISAHGSGAYGNDYDAIYTTYTINDVVNQAIGRGMRWVNPGISGGYLLQPMDSGAQSVTAFLNAVTQPGSQTWQIGWPANVLSVYNIPTAVTRLLITTTPAAPDLVRYVNALALRYQTSADNATAATYATAFSTLPANITAHGRSEDYWDLSAGGQMSLSTAQAWGNTALAKYVSASFTSPFTITHGQYLTPGGVPVDLACEHAGEVVRLVLAAGGYGAEVAPMFPVTFPVGAFQWDQDSQTAQVTPYQSVRSDLSGLLGAIGTGIHPRTQKSAKKLTRPQKRRTH
jgi:hypothetical protein